jgi:hypothetical protein
MTHDPAVPNWCSFLDREGYEEFIALVEADLLRRGEVEIGDGIVVLVLDDGTRHQLGLQNLAQVCNRNERENWPDIVRGHFDGVIRSTAGSDLEALARDFSQVKRVLKVRLYARETIEGLETKAIHRSIADDLLAVLVYDLPDAVATVAAEAPAQWPLELDEAFDTALQNVLDQDAVECEDVAFEDGARFTAMLGDSFFVTSRLLVLDKYLDTPPPCGALVAVPNRHTMLFAPITDMGVIPTINAIALLAHRYFEEGPGSLSPSLYWWRDGRLTILPAEVTDDGLRFAPPEEFVEGCLNLLADSKHGAGPN